MICKYSLGKNHYQRNTRENRRRKKKPHNNFLKVLYMCVSYVFEYIYTNIKTSKKGEFAS